MAGPSPAILYNTFMFLSAITDKLILKARIATCHGSQEFLT